jgi:hypothetical protein
MESVIRVNRQPGDLVAPANLPESNKSPRRIEFRVALVGAIAALLGAVIGGGASLLGTIYQEHVTTAAQVQSERKGAYVSYNTAMQNVGTAAFQAWIFLKLNYPAASWKSELNQFKTYLNSFDNSEDQVSLVASSRIYRNTQDQLRNAGTINLDLQELEFREINPSGYTGIPDKTTLVAKFTADYMTYNNNMKDFQKMARQDLGSA